MYVTDSVCTGDIVAALKEGCVSPFADYAEKTINLLFTALFGIVGRSFFYISPFLRGSLSGVNFFVKGWILHSSSVPRCSSGIVKNNCDTDSSIRSGEPAISDAPDGGFDENDVYSWAWLECACQSVWCSTLVPDWKELWLI